MLYTHSGSCNKHDQIGCRSSRLGSCLSISAKEYKRMLGLHTHVRTGRCNQLRMSDLEQELPLGMTAGIEMCCRRRNYWEDRFSRKFGLHYRRKAVDL